MASTAAPAAAHAPLAQWLRLLWDRTPTLRFDGTVPCISAGEIHLPVRDEWRHHAAAAAHATAHLVYSPPVFDGSGLGAVARALAALLEDARVEALAMRELPGLARVWRPRHTATPDRGAGFEAMMSRLARALVDPGYEDPDPWIAKGRRLFFIDAGLGLLALRTPAEVRHAATLLGHDIGQMRLTFDPRRYRPEPAYRDDHRWMWAADQAAPSTPRPSAVDASDGPDEPAADETATVHPEWDRMIARLRPDWCRVLVSGPGPTPVAPSDDVGARRAAHALLRPLRQLAPSAPAGAREAEGDFFDPAALVDWRLARRLRRATDPRVYRVAASASTAGAVWLLVDRSASTAARGTASDEPLLRTAARAAAALATALDALHVPCAIAAFDSAGRHAVRMRLAKTMPARLDADVLARLQALHAGGSTRLGAVLRHATARLVARGRGRHWIVLLSDGEPHDIDIHDPRYFVEDAHQAVREAAARGVRVACLALSAGASADLTRIFGRRGWHVVQGLKRLPQALRALL